MESMVPINTTVHDMLGYWLSHTPNTPAILYNNEQITYAELEHRAELLKQFILLTDLTTPIIGISTSRQIEMVVGILAILKAGKAYLPLDPNYPIDRLTQISQDAEISICLCSAYEANIFEKVATKLLVYDQDQPIAMSPSKMSVDKGSLAYVLYTSGSTGTPKGVCMGHKALINLLEWQKTTSVAGPGTKTLQFAPLSFDVSFQEIFATLSTGGTLVLIDDDMRLDSAELLSFIEKEGINRIFLPFVALQMLTDTASFHNIFPASLQEVITAGEQLKITPQVSNFFEKIPSAVLYNQYGPTECHVVTALKLDGKPKTWPELPNIGKPIWNTNIFILDEQGKELDRGNTGELCIGGISLADGYLNRPQLTAEKFIYWKHPTHGELRIYKTGDLARYLSNGEIEFLGRKDDQVKIRGHRIEPGEIEGLLILHPQVKNAVILARGIHADDKKLLAYLLPNGESCDTAELRKYLEKRLPEYMVPNVFIWMDSFPKTSSGKVDKKALPDPDIKRPELSVLYKKPDTLVEKNIAALWMELLQYDRIGINDNFFELGGNSLLAQKTVNLLKQRFGYKLPITRLYLHPTIANLAKFIEGKESPLVTSKIKRDPGTTAKDIAIIGMDGRFPGANSVEDLWEVLKDGKETISFFKEEELDPYIPASRRNDPSYVSARGVIQNPDQFDPAFFGISPRMAELMDPQQRLFLELSRNVLEKCGYLSEKKKASVGVFTGSNNNTYYVNNVLSHPEKIDKVGAFNVSLVSDKDYIATRTAYQLNLEGPAVSVFTACSTSLLAVVQAVESIQRGQCEVAIAGGVTITVPVNSGHIYEEGAMFSKDGHTRTFDAQATGTVFSDGAGVVLLKSLADARRDGDKVYAVIKGVGLNNDGSSKGSFTAPSAEGQAGAILMALSDANIDPSTISYVEAHGTATPLGDPIEIAGLKMAFGEQEAKQYCAIGSIKSNMGHLTHAAGVTGLIKTALSLHYKQLPPTINFEQENPNIDFKNSPFRVQSKLADWESQGTRRAGVSSFGVGGTNVHVIMEEAPEELVPATPMEMPMYLINWSAKTRESAWAYASKLTTYLSQTSDVNLAQIAYTLQTTRVDYNHRCFVTAANTDELISKLENSTLLEGSLSELMEEQRELAFMFPGQGAQYINMGKEMYLREPVFKKAVDDCLAILDKEMQESILPVLYPEIITDDSAAQLKNTYYTQPALFITEYALARWWISIGIKPTAFIGHSVGEFVGAHLAGVFSLADALKLIVARGKLISKLPKGSMLSVRKGIETVRSLLPSSISVAAINAPNLVVVAGKDEDIADFAKLLDQENIANKLLKTSHAFHSDMMVPIISEFEAVVKEITLNIPQMSVVSTVTGQWMKDQEATDPAYWAGHIRATVRFSESVIFLYDELQPVMLEVGPGNVTATLARQHGSAIAAKVVGGLDTSANAGVHSEYFSVLHAAGKLWSAGISFNWLKLYPSKPALLHTLPAYAYQYSRFWIDPNILPDKQSIQIVQENAEHTLVPSVMRKETLIFKIKQLLEDASGIDIAGAKPQTSFIELGLDSLLLTQIAASLKKEFKVPLTFRQLNEEYSNLDTLATYLDKTLPPDNAIVNTVNPAPKSTQPAPAWTPAPVFANNGLQGQTALNLIAQQMNLLAQQIALLQGVPESAVPHGSLQVPDTAKSLSAPIPEMEVTAEEAVELKKPFGATARIDRHVIGLDAEQEAFLKKFTLDYNQKTKASKTYCQDNRSFMADPRVVSGFKPLTKELVYSLVVNRSKGSRVWDLDGNEYIDALNGFGSNFLGYQPDFIKDALHAQVEQGYEIGPQHELAGKVCKLITEFIGHDRAALCNTGSEAVLGAMRIARTVTGRSIIVAFSGSYHGINDEVLVRGTKKLKTFPAASGILGENVQQMLILEYGTEESLNIIQERSDEIAAVLVEPVQSRRPEFQPVEFLKKLRTLTENSGSVLIFDEVITGFRMHPGGAQALFGIKADLGTYGKVIGGGISIGIIAGKKAYMDALDGGFWQYGDDSVPEVGVTYFAGTFVRHPLALATTYATLAYLKEQGPSLQQQLNERTTYLAEALNKICEINGIPIYIAHFGSLWKIKFKDEYSYYDLLFTVMRHKGIHIWDGFPCFLTTAHSQADIDVIIEAFHGAVRDLLAAGFIPSSKPASNSTNSALSFNTPPVAGARLGKDKSGNPAWFIQDPKNEGKYLQITANI
ncbi:amino acid adenylation domain-containing protein [bacterium A37T11]|nr:amino acid adenylation domain-containing protein [bacterium A37T11]